MKCSECRNLYEESCSFGPHDMGKCKIDNKQIPVSGICDGRRGPTTRPEPKKQPSDVEPDPHSCGHVDVDIQAYDTYVTCKLSGIKCGLFKAPKNCPLRNQKAEPEPGTETRKDCRTCGSSFSRKECSECRFWSNWTPRKAPEGDSTNEQCPICGCPSPGICGHCLNTHKPVKITANVVAAKSAFDAAQVDALNTAIAAHWDSMNSHLLAAGQEFQQIRELTATRCLITKENER